MFKKVIYAIVSISTATWILCALFGFTFVYVSNNHDAQNLKYSEGDTIQVLEELDFSNGDWTSYLIICREDLENLNGLIPKRMCLKLDDKKLFTEIKNEWNMIFTGGDVATVQSSIIFLQNGKIRFNSGIVLDETSEGF